MSYYIGSLPVVSDSANAKSEHLDYIKTVDYAKSQILRKELESFGLHDKTKKSHNDRTKSQPTCYW